MLEELKAYDDNEPLPGWLCHAGPAEAEEYRALSRARVAAAERGPGGRLEAEQARTRMQEIADKIRRRLRQQGFPGRL